MGYGPSISRATKKGRTNTMQRKPLIVGLAATVVYLALSILAACVTINVYFPEAAVKDLSEQIEEEILQQAAEERGATAAEEAPPTSAMSI